MTFPKNEHVCSAKTEKSAIQLVKKNFSAIKKSERFVFSLKVKKLYYTLTLTLCGVMFVMVKGRFEKKGKLRLITDGKHKVQRTFNIEGSMNIASCWRSGCIVTVVIFSSNNVSEQYDEELKLISYNEQRFFEEEKKEKK